MHTFDRLRSQRERAAYYLDFVAYPAISAALAALFCRSWAWVGEALAGFVLFTFVEYWTHRVLLHRFFYHGAHERHHTHPDEFVVFPIWYVPAIFAAFALVLPVAIFAGFCLGYTWFVIFHHMLHHWQLERHPLIRAYANWHAVHHAGKPFNYGITHPGFDFLFGTYASAEKLCGR